MKPPREATITKQDAVRTRDNALVVVFEVGAADPTVFVGIVAVLAVTGMVASFLPALRATRVDPTVAMRAE